ncbi:hypothetical protein [Methanosarcina mazei]|jgi:hypothetical protein|uniref:hypothetical protein n=1 Tax=Methanosarcina mazei TaxID=2209 RepID=UPI000A69D71A|nr:hypothetical protein [Methanosarcina mazei]WIM47809.1 hypothetical protein PQQ20_05945 [Methanosarcina mazei]
MSTGSLFSLPSIVKRESCEKKGRYKNLICKSCFRRHKTVLEVALLRDAQEKY